MERSEKVEKISPDLAALASDNRSIAIRGLRKVFHTTDNEERVAVKSLDMDIYEGQVTVLLGHNGC
jgi:ABC-type multidrug transport system ATPase subunit